MTEALKKPARRKRCDCPIYCKYDGAKLRRDSVGHYCPTNNCMWRHGVATCPVPAKKGGP